MATRTTTCPGCHEAVPNGRMSCPACGLLLASVAGAPRRRTKKATDAAPAPGAGVGAAIPAVLAPAVALPRPATATERTAATSVEPRQAVADPRAVDERRPADGSRAVGERRPTPAGAYVPRGSATSAPFLLPARAWAGITSAAPRPMAGFGVVATRPALAAASAGSASAYAVAPAGSMSPHAVRTDGPIQAAEATTPDALADDVEASWLEAAAGWLMIIGSAVAMLGFLLPWSRAVIGAEGVGTYFDSWGIANPSHILVVLALAAALGLAIVANPIPSWIRTCCVGLAMGGLLVGLSWPYFLGPLGAGPGVVAVLVGGIMLGAAGVLDLVEARHAPTEPAV